MIYLVVVAVLIVLVLSGVAAYYLLQVKKLNLRREEQAKALEQQRKEKSKDALRSIEILAQALLTDQVTLTEACIRINVLSNALTLNEPQNQIISIFTQLSEATAHIPILDAWKKLSTKEKMKFDDERLAIEANYKDFVLDAAKKISEGGLQGASA